MKAGVAASLLLIPVLPAQAAPVTLNPGESKVVLSDDSFTDGSGSVSFVVPAFSGPAIYLATQLRTKSNGDAYRARVRIESTGVMSVGFSRMTGGNDVRLSTVRLPTTVKVGERVNLNAAISGSTPVSMSVRAWVDGTPQPAWQSQYADSSQTRITGPGLVAAWMYLSGLSAGSATLTPEGLVGVSSSVVTTAPVAVADAAPSEPVSTTTPSKPSAATTGVPEGTSLTRHDGNITVTRDGAVLDKMDIYGFVTVKANNVRITNSRIRGGVATGNVGMVTNYGYSNLVIQDTDIMADNQSVYVDGIKGWNFTARRVHVVGGVDSVKIHGDNVRVEGSLLENTNYFAHDPNQGGRATHNDGIQIMKGNNHSVVGNTIRGEGTHTILAQATQGNVGVTIGNNWLDGAICNVKLQTSGSYRLTATVNNNKFGPNRVYQKCLISQQKTGNISLTQTGNTMELNPSTVVGVLME